MSVFRTRRIVRFSHCDPAGIIYYPRYFDLIHEAKEDWFAECLVWPFTRFFNELRTGLPIVHADADFRGMSRLGEALTIALTVPKIGTSSLHLHYEVTCGDEVRFDARTVVVHVALATGKSEPLPPELRARLVQFTEGAT
jgi:4-hydroxybenzoyl-CoA thioesterase